MWLNPSTYISAVKLRLGRDWPTSRSRCLRLGRLIWQRNIIIITWGTPAPEDGQLHGARCEPQARDGDGDATGERVQEEQERELFQGGVEEQKGGRERERRGEKGNCRKRE